MQDYTNKSEVKFLNISTEVAAPIFKFWGEAFQSTGARRKKCCELADFFRGSLQDQFVVNNGFWTEHKG